MINNRCLINLEHYGDKLTSRNYVRNLTREMYPHTSILEEETTKYEGPSTLRGTLDP